MTLVVMLLSAGVAEGFMLQGAQAVSRRKNTPKTLQKQGVSLTRNQMPRKGLGVRISCPPPSFSREKR